VSQTERTRKKGTTKTKRNQKEDRGKKNEGIGRKQEKGIGKQEGK
jgi:hypothetical protein